MNHQTFRGVQALRGLAALSVMLFHFRWNINGLSAGLGDRLFGWGATGVDLFFLISGFVIAISAANTPASLLGALGFLKKRLVRILPAYYIILLLTFLLGGAMSTFHYPEKVANLISAITFSPVEKEHAPFYVDDSASFGIRWTLNYEIYFYLVVGVLLAMPFRWVCIFSFFFLTLISLPVLSGKEITLSPAGYDFGSPWINLFTNPMIFLFLSGLLLGKALPYINMIKPCIMTGLLLVAVMGCFWLFHNNHFVGHGLLNSGWIYLLILTFCVGAERHIGNYIPELLVRLGDISYSLYLIHTLMNNGLGKRLESLGIETGMSRFLLSIILSVVLSWLFWKFIERPILKGNVLNRRSLAVR